MRGSGESRKGSALKSHLVGMGDYREVSEKFHVILKRGSGERRLVAASFGWTRFRAKACESLVTICVHKVGLVGYTLLTPFITYEWPEGPLGPTWSPQIM